MTYKFLKFFNPLQEKGNYIQAIEFFKESLELNPFDTSVLKQLGQIFEFSGEIKEANKCYKEAINVNPSDLEAKQKIKKIQQTIKKYDKEIINCKVCGKILPVDAKFCKECGSKVQN